MKIVLLEDEYSLRKNIEVFLQLSHYEVVSYVNGDDFLEKCRFDADLYILDINVPGANGFEIIQWISSNSPSIPVIFTTAFTDIDSISKAYTLGCSDYLKKPFDLIELKLRIEKLLPLQGLEKIDLGSDFVYSLNEKRLYHKGSLYSISPHQNELLKLLIEHANQLVTYDQMIDRIWTGKLIKINTIASHIREIRRLIPTLSVNAIRSEGYTLSL